VYYTCWLWRAAAGAAAAYESVREALLRRADVPHAVLTSSDWTAAVDDLQQTVIVDLDTAALLSAATHTPPPPTLGRSTSQVYTDSSVMLNALSRLTQSET